MHFVTSLTVSEGKRLIAKGIAGTPLVRTAMDKGIVVICPGTTNGYVAEELTGGPLDKTAYVTGRTLPDGYSGPKCRKEMADVVFKDGQLVPMGISEVLPELGPGDVFVKGANAINYDLDQAGVLIGHPMGGTLGMALGRIVAQRVHLIHPVGLEKSIPGDLAEAAADMKNPDGSGPTLWVSPGVIFTEIEALAILAEVEVVPISAGGIGGAEGAVWFMIAGTKSQLDRAREVLDAVRGEPLFIGCPISK